MKQKVKKMHKPMEDKNKLHKNVENKHSPQNLTLLQTLIFQKSIPQHIDKQILTVQLTICS